MLYAAFESYAGTVITVRPPAIVCFGPADHYLGLLALTDNDLPLARRHFEAALELAVRIDSPPFMAATQCELGGLLNRLGEHTEGKHLLESARALAEGMSLTRIAEQAQTYAGA